MTKIIAILKKYLTPHRHSAILYWEGPHRRVRGRAVCETCGARWAFFRGWDKPPYEQKLFDARTPRRMSDKPFRGSPYGGRP